MKRLFQKKSLLSLRKQLVFNFVVLLVLVFAPEPEHSPFVVESFWGALGSLAGGILGLAGSALSSSSSSSMNSKNLDFQNRWNMIGQTNWERLFQQHRDEYRNQNEQFNQLLNYQKEFNDPVHQAQRYRAAGINPLFALGNIQSGNIQTSLQPQAASAPPSGVSFDSRGVDPYVTSRAIEMGVGSIQSAFNDYFSNQSKAAETEQKMIDNLTRYDENLARLRSLLSNKDLSEASKDRIRSEIKSIEEQRDILTSNLRKQGTLMDKNSEDTDASIHLKRLQAQQTQLSNEYQGLVNSAFKIVNQAQLDQIKSVIRSNYASASAAVASSKLSFAKAASEAVETSIKQLQKKGIQVDLKYKNSLIKATLDGLKLDNDLKEWNYDKRYWDEGLKGISTISDAVSNFVPKIKF